MRTKTLEFVDDWGLDLVEITEEVKAVMGFDYFSDAEVFAD